MGIGVSNWRLANAVSRMGHLGVISGAALDTVFVRRLGEGDIGGHLRRAIETFPIPEIARRVYDRYFVPKSDGPPAKPKLLKMFTADADQETLEVAIVANFAEVTLAKAGHTGVVGINLLEKAQLGNLAALYGAMLAGVDYVLMGAGIPREIPGVLDKLADHEKTSLKIEVAGAASDDDYRTWLEPIAVLGKKLKPLKRPKFLAIISSAVLALTLAKKSNGVVNGFIVETPQAGGHNAPPRGNMELDSRGQPVYGSRDQVDLRPLKDLGLPFWMAGTYGAPGKLKEAKTLGAVGIQVGTAFAFCRESGLDQKLKDAVIADALAGKADVFTDPAASPTGFPFKVVSVEGSLSDNTIYEKRKRVCDIGYLRRPYKRDDGTLGYRCAAEPVSHYLRKGGDIKNTIGRKCLCNGLTANLGLGYDEAPIVTAGDEVRNIGQFLKSGETSYSAEDVIEKLLS